MAIIDGMALRQIGASGHLMFDGCDTIELARTYGTPLYVMSETAIRSRLRELSTSFMKRWPGSLAVYASKAFQTLELCRIVAQEGLGLDVVSGGELFAAIKAGFPPDRVFFHGNGKTEEELRMAVEQCVGRVVVDNLDELLALDRIALQAGKRQPILFRVTPGVDSHTHEYVSTGRIDSKFGIPLDPSVRDDYIGRALKMRGVELLGFHFHVGSQLLENDSHLLAIRVVLDLLADVHKAYGFTAREINLGGGFGVRYTNADAVHDLSHFTEPMMQAVQAGCAERSLPMPRVIIEPGRWVVGEAGITLYTVTSVKTIPGIKTWVAVDGGMTDNLRPALYGAKYEGTIADRPAASCDTTVNVAGKCCETGDVLIRDIAMQAPHRGDTLAVFTTGAYCHSMSSNYNRLPRPAVVMVAAGTSHLSVRRETYDDLVARELP